MSTTATPTNIKPSTRAWWKEAIIYQIYPSSFCDSNGDGIGDINGLISKLDYLQRLGVDVLWLSPIFKSPQKDMGYDVSDYRDIDPRYGTLEDWDRLVKASHERRMKIVLDLVANHTSDQHDWFKKSRSSKTNTKRDWYYWRPPKYDERGQRCPPNNWKSMFQGSAWDWDEETQEYYLHIYDPGQPDLNWENPVVRNAIHNIMRFWLDRGCDGFRMDAIAKISKVAGLPDAPITDPSEKYQLADLYYVNGPRVHEFIQEMNREVLSKYDGIMTVGEASYTANMHELAAYVLPDNHELNMVFQFELMDMDAGGTRDNRKFFEHRKWPLSEFKQIVKKWQNFLRDEGFWNTVFVENHDRARSVTLFANDSSQWRAISAKMLAILQISQSGTLYVYQGEEIAMANFPRSWGIDEYKDVATINYYNKILTEREKSGKGTDMSDILDGFQKKARDHARTPIQWDSSANSGFSTSTPWMRVNDDYKEWNVVGQMNRHDSVLSFWTKALKIRKGHDLLVYGDFTVLDESDDKLFVFTRKLGLKTALVLLNFTAEDVTTVLRSACDSSGTTAVLLLSNYADVDASIKFEHDGDWTTTLRGYEGRIYLSSGITWRTNK